MNIPMGEQLFGALGKTLILLGAIIIVMGIVLFLLPKMGSWKIPGDIVIKRDNFVLFIPLGTSILLSLLLTLILAVAGWLLTLRK